jgi:two-component system, cell cycle sensor histidine kinase PleC
MASHLADTSDGTIDRAFRMRHANGNWVWLRARAELVNQEGGTHVVGIAVDITEEKKFAERTATADVRLRDAVESISEAFVLWDADDRLVLCNSKFQQLYALPERLIEAGTSYAEVTEAGRQPIMLTPLRSEDRPEEGARSFEAQIADGAWLKISERRTKDGGFVSVGTDITELKRHEERLMESEKRQMATIVDLRHSQQALEIQAQQLAELAQKYSEEKTRAEDANRAKSEFLANMSHELRTPLNAIIGFSEIMESGMFGELGAEKYHEYCRDIMDSGRYLLDVINDILDMSKIEAGRCGSILKNCISTRSYRGPARHVGQVRGKVPSDRFRRCAGLGVALRPARAQADHAQSARQFREVHAGRRARLGARERVPRLMCS